MEYKLNKDTVYTVRYALDSVTEQPVDADVTLPDYCPDIERILRCSLSPCVFTRNISGTQLFVEGEAKISILYIDSVKSAIRCFSYQMPWSAQLPLKTETNSCAAILSCKTEYINCRALSPRKLSFHGAFSLYAKVLCRQTTEVCRYDEKDDLQTKRESVRVSSLCCLCEERFSCTEDIPLSDRPSIEAVLSSRIRVKTKEEKCMDGKLMLSMQGDLEVMYLCDLDKGEIEHLSYSFPLSRMIDCEGLTENSVCDTDISVQSYDLSVSRDALSDGSLLSLELKLCACVKGFEEQETEGMIDAYSTSGGVELSRETLSMPQDLCVERFSRVEKYTLSLENEKIGEVLDIGVESASACVIPGENAQKLLTKLRLSLLLKNTDGEPFCIERSPEFECAPETNLKQKADDVCVKVDSVSYRIVDEKTLELRMELSYRITTSDFYRKSLICGINRCENSVSEPCDSALVLYFADKGESVWEIAKNYATRVDDLKEENALEDEILSESMMLLIPVPN